MELYIWPTCSTFSPNHILCLDRTHCLKLRHRSVWGWVPPIGWGRFENTSKASLGGRSTQTTNTNPDTPPPPQSKYQITNCFLSYWHLAVFMKWMSCSWKRWKDTRCKGRRQSVRYEKSPKASVRSFLPGPGLVCVPSFTWCLLFTPLHSCALR